MSDIVVDLCRGWQRGLDCDFEIEGRARGENHERQNNGYQGE